jgi:serine/threonine-protein kinase RIM15
MTGEETPSGQFLAPPVVNSLRGADVTGRIQMERTASSDIREERDDLKAAAEQSLNVILDLGLDGTIRWVSPSWKDVIGSPALSVKGTPIADILVADRDSFANAVESMKKDDSRSQIVRFQVLMGPESVLRPSPVGSTERDDNQPRPAENAEAEQLLNLEGQGIMVYDWASGGESHVCRKTRVAD